MKKIDYDSYLVYPYTRDFLKKTYTKDVLDLFGSRLALLYQNGIKMMDKTAEALAEQFGLFFDLNTWEDLDSFLKIYKRDDEMPTEIGYKIVDSAINLIVKNTSWALTDFIDVKTMGKAYRKTIEKMCLALDSLVRSDDIEVKNVVKRLFSQEFVDLLDSCLDIMDNHPQSRDGVLLIKYQDIYRQINTIHKAIYVALLKRNDKCRMPIMGNVNDEIYGSSGFYNPKTGEIKCVFGSAVQELKMLCSKTIDDNFYFRLLVLAKGLVKDGENDKTLVAFAKGDKSKTKEAKEILTEISFNGIVTLLCLKHGMTLIEDDSFNEKKAERVIAELENICKFTGYEMRKTA